MRFVGEGGVRFRDRRDSDCLGDVPDIVKEFSEGRQADVWITTLRGQVLSGQVTRLEPCSLCYQGGETVVDCWCDEEASAQPLA
jgi:hypothetical protein